MLKLRPNPHEDELGQKSFIRLAFILTSSSLTVEPLVVLRVRQVVLRIIYNFRLFYFLKDYLYLALVTFLFVFCSD